jgi:hypothetical protein
MCSTRPTALLRTDGAVTTMLVVLLFACQAVSWQVFVCVALVFNIALLGYVASIAISVASPILAHLVAPPAARHCRTLD